MARTALGKGLAPLMAGNKPVESAPTDSAATKPGPGVVTLILGRQFEPVPEATPEPVPAPAAVVAPQVQEVLVTVLPVWPFVLADGLLVGAGMLLLGVAPAPLNFWVCLAAMLLVGAGGLLTLLPLIHNAGEPLAKPPPVKRKFGNRPLL